jgi:adenosylcobalamin-dependent ribonucleoside-triphosphate reductase
MSDTAALVSAANNARRKGNGLKAKTRPATKANGHSNGHAAIQTNGFTKKNGFAKKQNGFFSYAATDIEDRLEARGLPKKRMRFASRQLDPGMGKAVARRTYLRKIVNAETGRERWETWEEVADRVARGNSLLAKNFKSLDKKHIEEEYKILKKHLANASMLMSGRHLQHGDETQPSRNMEVFTNCSTASASYVLFYLLMNGSGVGRAYDDDMCVVNWDNMPNVRCVISDEHPDFVWGADESVKDAEHKYGKGDGIHWFHVPDTREGWAQAVEMIEVMAYEKKYKDELLIIDFSQVREKGQPIRGMQNRPASGPKPLMNAIERLATIKGAGMSPWKQAIFVDHYLAECVLVGGARRSARIATKVWTDPEIFDFINIKRGGFLWSANNSVAVDDKFWKQRSKHAQKVLDAIIKASYEDGTGEPGFINQHMLVQNDDGYDDYVDGKYAESDKYVPFDRTRKLLTHVARNAGAKVYSQIPNPCGEISLNMLGGYCVIGDVVPYHAPTLDDAEEAFRATARALIRVNSMDSLYHREVKRTNRIGVGMTGIHEFAWNQFGYAFHDLIDEEKSKDFWMTLARFKRAVVEEAETYSKKLGVNVPHTNTTIKPSGTVSKLFALTEGAHLPSMREYIRWVQYRSDDPQVKKYKKLGYPVKELKSYQGTTAVGFPTQPLIRRLGMGDRLVTAAEASPEEQYKWLMLLEKYWIVGVDEQGNPLSEDTGNQVSYTLKYDPEKVAFKEYADMVRSYQSQVKCCSLMPQQDATAYEYQPEQPVTISEFMKVLNEIEKNGGGVNKDVSEDIDYEHLKCESGACPI